MMLLKILPRAATECALFRPERGASQGLRAALTMRKGTASEGVTTPEDVKGLLKPSSGNSLQQLRPILSAQVRAQIST